MIGRGRGASSWVGAVFTVLGLLSAPLGCDDSSGGESECERLICVRNCEQNADCPADEYCAPTDFFSRKRQCQPGCRDDAQCAPDFCRFGRCQSGCRQNEHCPAGQVCSFANDFTSEQIGECITGCRGDEGCETGEHCICASCTRDACDSSDDCGPEEYCPTALQLTNTCHVQCNSLPPPIACGRALCRATSVLTILGEFPVTACCAGSSGGECGLESGDLLPFGAGCQAFAQPGEVDPSCGPDSGGFTAGESLPACRRPDETCGYRVDALGLGCVARDP